MDPAVYWAVASVNGTLPAVKKPYATEHLNAAKLKTFWRTQNLSYFSGGWFNAF